MQLSEHFAEAEFECEGTPIPPYAIPALVCLCENILEPIRSHVGEPLIITFLDFRQPRDHCDD